MDKAYNIQCGILFIFVSGIACMLGPMAHSFIVVVNITDWMKGQPVTTIDQILFSLGVSRIIFQCIGLLNVITIVDFSNIGTIQTVKNVIYILEMSSDVCGLWLSTLLSVVFCLKISSFRNVLFLRVKTIILREVVPLMIFILVFSFSYSVLGAWGTQNHMLQDLLKNMSQGQPLGLSMKMYYIMGNALPFLINCASTILVLVFLCLHLSRMKNSHCIITNMAAYYIAIKAITSCFMTFSLHVLTCLIVMDYIVFVDIVYFYITTNFFPVVHSIYLISIITRLRNALSSILHHGTNFLFGRKCSEPIITNQIETNIQ